MYFRFMYNLCNWWIDWYTHTIYIYIDRYIEVSQSVKRQITWHLSNIYNIQSNRSWARFVARAHAKVQISKPDGQSLIE